MRTPQRNFIIGALPVVATLAAAAVGLHAQDVTITGPTPVATSVTRDAESAALFRTYCATCHEGPGANPEVPGLEVMRRMSAEQVLEALEGGAMRTQARERSRAQRRVCVRKTAGHRCRPFDFRCLDAAVSIVQRRTRPATGPAGRAGLEWLGAWHHERAVSVG